MKQVWFLPAAAYWLLMGGGLFTLVDQPVHPESYYRDELAEVLGGDTEYRLPDGTRVDVLTEDVAFEVDTAQNLWNATGQSLWYGKRTNRTPGMYLIVRKDSDEAWIKRARVQCRELGILLFVRDVRNAK